MVALWPPGLGGETESPRVVDAGNLAAYFSYPLSDHGDENAVRASGPDYLIIPTVPLSRFQAKDKTFTHENRWAVILQELRSVE
jgi:hypothetical protein